MNAWQRRIVWTMTGVVAAVVSYAVVYQWGMQAYEGLSVPFTQAVQVVIEAITTAGFGGHAPWSSTVMNVLVLAMNLTGVLFVFLAIPLFIVPLLRDAFEEHSPTTFSGSEHVVVTPHTARIDALIRELEGRGQSYVILEPDRTKAEQLHMEGYTVVHGDAESTEALERIQLSDAKAIVTDAPDEVATSIVLSARELNGAIQIVTVADSEELEPYHWLAGADHVLSPRQLLGRNLAREVPLVLSVLGHSAIEIGKDLEIAEVDVAPSSPLCNQSLADVQLRDRFEVNVLGAWFEGVFTSPVSPQTTLDARTRLLLSGAPESIDRIQNEMSSVVSPRTPQRIVVIGYGKSGQAAVEAMAGTNAQFTIIDAHDKPEVDVVGDARNPDIYERARIADADSVIIDTDDDATTLFATLITRDANPEAHIVARANEEGSVHKLYRAGADYVQSLSTISGRMMVSTILAEEEVLTLQTKIDIVRLDIGRLAGQTLAQADVQAATGCIVVAVEREGDVITSPDPRGVIFQDDDQAIVLGTDESVQRFEKMYLR